jgi:hypothetical protein
LSVTFFASAESLVLLVASLFLLFCSEGLVKIITGPDSDLCEKVDIRWVAAGFQMTFCFCGLLMIYSCLTRLFYYIPAIFREPILSYTTLQGQEALFLQRSLAGGFETIIDSFIAVYLIFGAPHYIRWQLRKLSAKESNQIIGVEKYE